MNAYCSSRLNMNINHLICTKSDPLFLKMNKNSKCKLRILYCTNLQQLNILLLNVEAESPKLCSPGVDLEKITANKSCHVHLHLCI